MKTTVLAVAALAMMSNAALALGPFINPDILREIRPLHPIGPLFLCSDLRVTMSVQPPSLGAIPRATVRVENVGVGNYVSGAGQQRVRVVIARSGGATEETFGFVNVSHGQVREWTFELPHNQGALALDASLVFAPSVLLDGNPQNNECNPGNNTAHANA